MNLLRDAGYALRSFRRSPGFTAAAVVSIALGIAANTTVFSIVNGLLLGNLPVADAGRLVGFSGGRTFSYPDYVDYRDQAHDVFEGVCAHFPAVPASFGGGGEPERIWGQLVTGNYFGVIQPRFAFGRGITGEDEARARPVAVLSHALWRRRFAGDASIAGRTVLLNGLRFTVIGVTAPDFTGTDRGIRPEFWAPLAMRPQLLPDMAADVTENRGNSWLSIDARLKNGVSREQAQAAVTVIKKRIDDAWFKDNPRWRRRPVTLGDSGGLADGGSAAVGGLMAVLMGVVGLVLLIACANVANLLLARAAAREKEMAIRLSLGVGRGRLVRQLLTESLLLASFGAAIGLALAWLAAGALSRFEVPLPLPIVFDFTPDARVLAFTAGLTVLTAILFGLVPALRATRLDLTPALKGAGAGRGGASRTGMRGALVVVQVALSVVLLAASAMFLRSLKNAASIDPGLRPGEVLLMAVDPKLHRYTPEQTRRFIAQLRERVSALPDVRSVTFLDSLPLSIGGSSGDFKTADARQTNAHIYTVGSRFFETMGLPLLRGRDFAASDGKDAAIINEVMARRLFAGDDPVGRQLDARGAKYTVIGVAANAKSRTLGEEPVSCAYLYLEAAPEKIMSFYGISIAAKTGGNARRLAPALRAEIAALDPTLAVFNTMTMREHLAKALLLPRICALLLTVFAAVGLTLAAIGLYGVMSYSVRRRTREFGIRMALGAGRAKLLRMAARQGLVLTGIGLGAGLAAAAALSRFAAGLLYGAGGLDLTTLCAAAAVLMVAGLAAVLVPARRAAGIDPTEALRYE